MGVVGRLDQYASMLAYEFDDYSMSENLFTYSNDFSQSVWTKTRTNILANSTTAPDGTNTAFKLYDDTTASASHRMTSTNIIPAGLALPTGSIFIKAGEYNRVVLSVIRDNGTAFAGFEVAFDLISGTIRTDLGYSGTTGKIEPYPNGWYRISNAATVAATTNYALRLNLLNLSSAGTYTGDGTSGVYIWEAQLETGSVATNYTPTTTTAISRVLPATTNTNITGLGTYYASEFSENVGITTALDANIFPPYDIVYDEFGGTLFGAGQGRYMRQNTDKSVIVYNEIDEISDFYGRGIVRDGLVLDLDAGVLDSYPGSGTTWTDLSGGGNTGTLAGNTSFSSQGYFVLDGVNGTRITTSGTTYPSTWNQAVTFEIWAYFDADGTWHNTFYGGLFSRGSTAGSLGLTRANGDNSVRMWLRDDGGSATAAGTVVRDAWYQIVGTWGGVANLNLKLYLNGVETGSFTKTTISGSPDIGGYSLGGMSSTLSGSPGNYMKGRISAARMYDRELSAAEILQNYNALKHRFGL